MTDAGGAGGGAPGRAVVPGLSNRNPWHSHLEPLDPSGVILWFWERESEGGNLSTRVGNSRATRVNLDT